MSPSLQIRMSGQISVVRLNNLSSLEHNSKISCTAENIVGEKESSLLLDILCTPPPHFTALNQTTLYHQYRNRIWDHFMLQKPHFKDNNTSSVLRECINFTFCLPVPPKITKLSDAIPDHHWCIPFSVSGERCFFSRHEDVAANLATRSNATE